MTQPPPNSPNPGTGPVPWCMCGCNGQTGLKLRISLERELMHQPQDPHLDTATADWAKSQVNPRPLFASDEQVNEWIAERVDARLQHLEELKQLIEPGTPWVRPEHEEKPDPTKPLGWSWVYGSEEYKRDQASLSEPGMGSKLKIALESELLYSPQDPQLDARTAVWVKTQVNPRPHFDNDEQMDAWIAERVEARLRHLESLERVIKSSIAAVEESEMGEPTCSVPPADTETTEKGMLGKPGARALGR